MAIHEKSPSAKHVPKLKEEIVSEWLCKNVRFLLSSSAIRDLNLPILDKRTKVMVFQCDVFCARSKFLGRCHRDARLIILMHFACKRWRLHVNRKDCVNLLEERDQRNHVTKSLREGNVLSFSSAEGNFGL